MLSLSLSASLLYFPPRVRPWGVRKGGEVNTYVVVGPRNQLAAKLVHPRNPPPGGTTGEDQYCVICCGGVICRPGVAMPDRDRYTHHHHHIPQPIQVG